ncbi:hypothetical protein I307_06288 [Cryptococcus deuterogattii 99/473]|uniref:Unplaced genomic scaffold supercont1.15, whole genome shotgun sequence n=1 Tax=Cryptococcus deuterogattii Ram5 TaxID=1296110 RepID=A0A0D0UW77_9TREE|nr:hypothetical protein I309_05853 [Cryptococcus deuterogattii LA55]KIR38394.1 hypothetical protein I313_05502 [Cryptococcus deuterogattii Ram5]KIR69654.1 hypothetical protein I310_06605 [Cryptococcus deuterogattii CA1014]KIR89601.1 hypothetical protein I304_06603 [Cryptococcus deuterogattii CBS 10090]KIY54403.1 hypothetical protein I307_06288 [Cryptococcus deuterogattii 99/473]
MSYSDLPHKPTIPVEPFKLSIPDEDIKVPHILLKSTRIAKESYENVSAENNKRKQEEGINSLPAFKAKFKKIRRFGILHSFHSPFLEEDVRNSHHSQSRLAR